MSPQQRQKRKLHIPLYYKWLLHLYFSSTFYLNVAVLGRSTLLEIVKEAGNTTGRAADSKPERLVLNMKASLITA